MNTQACDSVKATLISENKRGGVLPHYFGRHFIRGEMMVYNALENVCSDYNGGFWDFYELSNGGFFMAPRSNAQFHIQCDGNYFDGQLSATGAGIVACLMAFSGLASLTEEDRIINLFHQLREYAHTHEEAALIFQAID